MYCSTVEYVNSLPYSFFIVADENPTSNNDSADGWRGEADSGHGAENEGGRTRGGRLPV